MSQARHVNCKWQSKNERNTKDVRSKAEKFRSDKLAMDIPPGISKDELVKYFKKYGKVVAAREINSQFIVQMESHEPVDLAIELQAISEHEARGISFHVRRWNADDDEIRMWEERSGMKRKAESERLDVKSVRVAPTAPGPLPIETPLLIPSQPRGERNQFGHLPGCECKTCKLLGEELARVQAKQEQKSPVADTPPAPPPPPEPAPVQDTTEYNPFVAEEWVKPEWVEPEWVEPEWVEPVAPQNPFGHLEGCICPKCRKWAAGISVEDIMLEVAAKQKAKQPAPVAENFAPQSEDVASSAGNSEGYSQFGQGRSIGVGMLTGTFNDNESSMSAMSAMPTMSAMSTMMSTMSSMMGPPGPTGHLPGCLCKTCRGASGLAPAPKQEKPKPAMPAKGKHLPGCLCPACSPR